MSDHKKCWACDAMYDPDDSERWKILEKLCIVPDPAERRYCKSCANEKFRGIVNTCPAKLHSSGAGCPLEPSDDAGPWQENNIRAMEGD